MSNRLDYVEYRLIQWADWIKKGNGFGLGYPSKTPEQRLRDMGGIWVKVTGAKPLLSHPAAEEIEDYVRELHDLQPLLASTVRIHYLDSGTTDQKAKKLAVAYGQYRAQLERAKYWLFGRLQVK